MLQAGGSAPSRRAADWASKMATTTTTSTTETATTSSMTTRTATLRDPPFGYVESELAAELARVGIIVRPLSQRSYRRHGSNVTRAEDVESTVSKSEISPSVLSSAVHDLNISAEALAASVSALGRLTNASGLRLVDDASTPARPANISLGSLGDYQREAEANGSMPIVHGRRKKIAAREEVNGSIPWHHAATRGIDGLSAHASAAANRGGSGYMPVENDTTAANATESRMHGLNGSNLSVQEGFSTDSGSSSSNSGPHLTTLGFCLLLGTLALCAGLAGLWMAWTRRSRRVRITRGRGFTVQDNNSNGYSNGYSNGSNGVSYRALPTEDLDVEERSFSSPEQLGNYQGSRDWSSVARPPQVGLTPPPSFTMLPFPLTSLGAASNVWNRSWTAVRPPQVLQTLRLVRPPPVPTTTVAVPQTSTAPVVIKSVVRNGRAVSPPRRSVSPPRRVTTTSTQAHSYRTLVPANAPTTSWLS
jgi:hypothetical protein